MLIRRTRIVLVWAIGVAFLTSCSRNETPVPMPPVSPLVSPLPTPTPMVPDPQNGKGTVVGIFYNQDKPYSGQYIYLARIREMQSPSGTPFPLAELDIKADPFAQTDAAGRFIREDVEPGKYGFAIVSPSLRQFLLADASTKQYLSVEVKPGQISNLGVVSVLEAK